MNYAVVLAGGIGTRFWPLSRELEPKQFLSVYSDKPMIEETLDRISPIIKKNNIYVATSKMHNRKIKKCLRKLNLSVNNILFEPESKNTLAPIAVLSRYINNLDSEAVMAVLPCDHFIKHNNRFLKLLKKGIEIARMGYIVSLGISPSRPETGYGYIKTKAKTKNFFLIEKFIEKPNSRRARKFLRDKRFYWNSGIFIFRPQVMLEEIKKFISDVYKIIIEIKNKEDFNRLWHKLPSVSLDCAVMEKTKRIVMLPADCGWIDLGSWEAITEVAKKDKNGNVFRSKYIDIGSKNILVWSDKRLITTVGLNNIIIIDTDDALLVCRKDMSQKVKKVVQSLREKFEEVSYY